MEKSVIQSLSVQSAYPRRPGERLPTSLSVWPRASPGIRTANFIFAGGAAGVDQQGQVVAPGDGRLQVRAALDRLRRVVEAGGALFADVFKIRWYLTAATDRDAVMLGVADYLAEHSNSSAWPVMSQIVAESSSGLIRAEIEAFAATSHTVVRCPELYAGLAPGREWPNHAHATWVGNLLFTSGQLALARDGSLACKSARDQSAYVFGAIDRILQAAGQSPADLVKLTVWIADDEDRDAVTQACGRYLRERIPVGRYPALTMLMARLGVAGARVQVEAIAARGPRTGVECPGLGTTVSHDVPHAHAVRVPLTSPVGSYLRRFSWPAGATDSDRAQLGGQLEHPQALGSLVFYSSVAGVNADRRLAGAGMRAQADRVFENLRAVSEAAGGRFSDIVQFNVYFAQRSLYQEYNEARVEFVEANVPDKDWFTGSGIQARSTLDGALMEIEAIAAIG